MTSQQAFSVAWRDLKYESIDFSIDNFLELFDDSCMKFVKFILWHYFPDEFPENNVFSRSSFDLLVFNSTNQVLALSC